jgi:DNA polymerase III epsilon subunit-like protein
MHLFFDTETTGLPRNYKAPVSDAKNWPRIVQIAWLLTDDEGTETSSAEFIIKPDGFTIPAEAASVHGITTEIAIQSGHDLRTVLDLLVKDLAKATVLIAHNMRFDEKIVGAEFLRLRYPNHIETKKRRCTMASSTDYCELPGNDGYKWPRLEELHWKLFKKGFDGAHRALVDVRACAKCYFELIRLKVLK